ncbi:MAG: TraR/DksA family transcriptional regulator [Alphaproteobacteria bacterium]|nr:TraR/DksA family transcriptional regulator [Alphaproteobacteria bacterium]
MTDNLDTAHFKSRLEARREELNALHDLSASARGAVELDQTSVGRVSRIDAMQQQQMALASERQRAQELVRIDAALQRISDGCYGDCLICDEPIAVKRLEFDAAITTCIDCASKG